MTTLRAGSATDTGVVRSVNQDQFLVREGIFAVADGMGGHQGGEVASQTAVDALEEEYDKAPRSLDSLIRAAKAANTAVWERAQKSSELRGMGTTLTAVALIEDDGEERLAIAHIGDSRAYLFRNDEFDQLTQDHSLVEELIRTGQIRPEEGANHPRRNIITRSVGIEVDVEPDVLQIVPVMNDRILLCSDGLVREVGDDQIAAVLRRLADPQEAAQELVRMAKQNGGSDNITVVIVDVVDDDGQAERASASVSAPFATAEPVANDSPDEDHESGPKHLDGEHRMITPRVVIFTVVLLGVLAAGAYAVNFYARGSFFVGFNGDGRVTIFRGHPGGILWWDPTVERVTNFTSSDVPRSRLEDIRKGKQVDSVDDGARYILNIREEATGSVPGGAGQPGTGGNTGSGETGGGGGTRSPPSTPPKPQAEVS